METPEFLPERYPELPGSKPVERAVQKKLQKGKKGPQTKEERVEAYLERLEDIIKDKRGFELIKHQILEKYTTKYEEIPESYWKAQEEEMRRRGEAADWSQATEKQKEEIKRKTAESVLTDQRASLEQWVDYFASSDSDHIPRNLKYWVFRSVLGLQELVKKKEDGKEYIEFPKRSKGTVKPFPDINYEALGYVVDATIKNSEGKGIEFEHDIQPEERKAFLTFLQKQDFAKLYGWANELMTPIPKHLLPVTEGKWVKYAQGSNPKELVKTIRGKGTGWCTAGLNTAKTHLQGGDFYVYYSLDDKGEPTLPRVAIRMSGHDKIAEDPRGIAYKQNLDPYMGPILEKKLKEFGVIGDAYKKKTADMKHLTDIENKAKRNESLAKDDLIFLYELKSPIEGFGYQKDPRIQELRSQRNPEEDMLIIFEATKDQIARNPKEITLRQAQGKTIKAYVGPLVPGIFDKIQEFNIEHIYTSFPEGRIEKKEIEIGGKTEKELEKEMKDRGINTSNYAKDMMRSKDFTILKTKEQISTVRLKVKDLFPDNKYHTTDEIYKKAQELGLELCPAEVGPNYRLQHQNQPLNEWIYIAMKQITDRGGLPNVFELSRRGDGLWLDFRWARPTNDWFPEYALVFSLRKSKTQSL
ncbi:MAG: hypothetical protein AAB646_00770 [Patescibacteria group bacterium]